MEEQKCVGCGAALQTEDKQAPGYVPRAALEQEQPVCRRCFRLKHYNEVPDVTLDADDFSKMLKTVSEKKALIVYVIDIFDVNGSWIPGLEKYIGNNDLMLAANKVDLLPKSTNENKLKNWLRRMCKDRGLKPVEVCLMSAEKGTGVAEAAAVIDESRNGRDVYVVGCTNVGKSTFINKLIAETSGESPITTSRFPGTTLSFIDIPMDESSDLFDTPGIINPGQIAHSLKPEELKLIMPRKEIKPRVFQLNEGQTLFFAGLGRMDYDSGDKNSFIVYMANDLYLHRTKMERADELYETQVGELLTPPLDKTGHPQLVKHEIEVDLSDTDVVFSGLGWVTVKQAPAKLLVYAPENTSVFVRESIIKG